MPNETVETQPDQDVLFQGSDGKWYFWEEGWAYKQGPFETKEIAKDKLDSYIASLS